MKKKSIKSQEKLAHRVLQSMAIRVTLIVLLSSLISYFHLYTTIEEGMINTLQEYVVERTERESFVFNQAKKNHDYLKSLIDSFILKDQLKPSNSKRFQQYFEQKPDGTYRNKKGYDGTKMAGLFLPPHYDLTDQKRSLIIYLKDLAETLGPAYRSNFQDTYFTTPENAMVIFWPEVPNWTMEMKPDFKITTEEYVWIASKKHNPKRQMVWTGLFYDQVAKVWMTSAETPIYKKDQHLLTIGHDVMLSELLERTQKETLPGAYNVIFRKDGRLIIHPNKIQELKDQNGYYDINKSKNIFLKDLVHSILNAPKETSVVQHRDKKNLLAFGKIKGQEWYFVTVYPKSLITATALKGIFFVIILAFISLIIEVFMLWVVIKKEISEPIEELFEATVKMTKGDFHTTINLNRNDELGVFATTFNSMSEAILERDRKLQEYAQSLEKKVRERTLELDKQRAIAIETAKMASLGEMAGGIAHEINNPLTVISGSVSLIVRYINKESIDFTRIDKLAEKITFTIKRIENIINGLRTFARTGEQDQFQEESLYSIIEETIALCEHKIKMHSIDLQNLINKENDVTIKCQKVQISQVILNLISNAADEISVKNRQGWIKISFETQADTIQIRVQDSGSGIAADVQQKMFQPFFTTKDVGVGTGIGLSISSGIMKTHDGRIFVDNETTNTCLVMELPKKLLKAIKQ
jgi:two-component system NtrC family sensor kinase